MAKSPEPLGRPETRPSEPKVSILLVDDNPANLLSLQALLDNLGQTLVEARSGEEALRAVKADEFAVVLLDVLMPGISGFETARLIREVDRARHTPIIFLTAGDTDRKQLEEGYAIGAVDFLVKPLSPIALHAKVRGFVELFQDKLRSRREAEQLRLLVERAQDYAIFRLDPEGRVASWNLGAERIKQFKAEEIIGQHFSRFYPQDAIDRGWPAHELDVARAEGRFEDEGWRIRKDGSRFWANVVITALRDEAGTLRGFSKITRDMTERKRAEENARRLAEEAAVRRVIEENARLVQEQRDRLHVTLASIGDAVISTDAEGRVDFLNPVAQELVGWTTADAAGRTLADVFRIVNEDTRRPVENPAVRALKEGVVVGLANHTVLIARDGSERPIDDSAAPIRDAEGRVVGSVLVFRDISESRRAQMALRESEGRWRSLAEALPNLVWTDLPNGQCDYLSSQWGTYTGIPENELLGLTWLERVIHPDDRERTLACWTAAVEDKAEYDLEYRIRRRDGQYRWFKTRGMPVRDGQGRIVKWFGTCTDIEDQKQAQEALQQSEERFRQLADAMPQIVWTARPDGNIDYQNQQWREFTGLPETAGNDGWGQIVHPDDARPAGERWAACVRTGAAFEMEIRLLDRRHKAYRWHLIRTVAVLDDAGKVLRWFGTSTEIHEQKRAEESSRYLAAASAALASVVDYESTLQKVANLAVPYFADWSAVDVANEDGSLRRLAVAHQDAAKVRLVQELMQSYPPDPDAPGGVAGVLRSGKPEIIGEITDDLLVQGAKDEDHLRLIRSLGLQSYICVPLVVSGNPLGVLTFATAESGRRYTDADLAVAMDLAQRAAVAVENTQLYQALRETDRRKDEFLATLAHELRNPLAPIRNSLQILKMPRLEVETIERAREMMERQVHQLVRLVDDLLDVSRVMRGKIELRTERVELAAVVARAVETVQPLMEAQGHEFTANLPRESLPLDADPVRLAQVVGNLLTNAAKYTEANGHIRLTARREGDEAVLRVRDDGIGIAPDMLANVFDLFVQVDHAATRSQGGLGIGLTLVKNLVGMHRGTVEAHSEGVGQGSEFVVRLPLSAATVAEPGGSEDTRPELRTTTAGRRLLVVDDNKDAADSLAMLLRLEGHEVRVAYDGPAALNLVTGYRPEIVFLDIGMPGMDGYEVARRLRQQPGLENVLLAALTGWGQQEDRRRTTEAGFDRHFVKPPDPKALEDFLDACTSGLPVA